MVDDAWTACPLTPGGICLYEACPYWDQGTNACNACFQQENPDLPPGGGSAGHPCLISWMEDGD